MKSQIRNILIFVLITGALVFVYLNFLKPSDEEANLISSNNNPFPGSQEMDTSPSSSAPSLFQEDLVSLLLNVESIRLEADIFQNSAFKKLRDSSIVLVPPGNEGRINPFAPIGFDPLPIVDDGEKTQNNPNLKPGSSKEELSSNLNDKDLEGLGDLDDLLNF